MDSTNFPNCEFEPALSYLMDVFDEYWNRNLFGLISKKNEHFSVMFILRSIVNGVLDKKRKILCDGGGASKKVRKLNESMENLALCVNEITGGSITSDHSDSEAIFDETIRKGSERTDVKRKLAVQDDDLAIKKPKIV